MCGNHKVESGEQCDDGNTVSGDGCSSTCQAEAALDTFVHFQFISTEFPGFDGETCLGLGIAKVKIDVSGPKPSSETVDCSLSQVKLSYLPAGAYTVTATAYDAGGAPLSRGLAKTTFTAGTTTQNVTVDFPYEDFMRSYTGTYFFKVRWGGATTCEAAAPPVVKERVRLERDGAALAGATGDGTPIDGSRAGPCHGFDEAAAQFATGLPWGPATVTVTGEDGAGTPLYRKTFDTFVGADLANPTAVLDVPSLFPDAGVADAPGADSPIADAGGHD